MYSHGKSYLSMHWNIILVFISLIAYKIEK